MSREIRISVADEEVFEWMRRRKTEFDLSWEEALRRGLGEDGAASPTGEEELDPFAPDFRERLQQRIRSATGAAVGSEAGRPAGEPTNDADRPRERAPRARERATAAPEVPPVPDVGEIVAEVTPPLGGPEPPTPPEPPAVDQLARLEDAEDAVLVLPGTDEAGARVPLRVNLRTEADGLAVEVVAVRQGSGTEALNHFVDGSRADVTRALAEGEPAALELGDGAESYPVRPSLTWGRDDDGTPTVVEAAIVDVLLGDDE